MWKGMKVLKGEITPIVDVVERLHDSGPVRRTIQQRAKTFQAEIGSFLRVLLKVNVSDARSKQGNPVLRKLKWHDVSSVEMNMNMGAFKAVDKLDDVRRTHEISIEKNILDIEVHA